MVEVERSKHFRHMMSLVNFGQFRWNAAKAQGSAH